MLSMRSSSIVFLHLSCCLILACKSGTGPDTNKPAVPNNATHPAGSAAAQIIGLGGRPFGVYVTASGDVLVTEQDLNQAVHVDSLGGKAANIPVGLDPGDVVATSTGTAFVSGFNDGTLAVVNLSNNTVTKTVRVSQSNAYRLVLSKDESLLYITSTDGHIYTLNTSTRSVTGSLSLNASQSLALNHAGTELYASTTSGTVWRLDLPGLTTGKSVSLSCATQDVALAIDDSELYVACENGSVMVLDPSTLATKTTITLNGAAPFGLAVTPDNAELYVASARTSNLTIIDRATRAVVKTLPLGGTPRRVAFNRIGNKAYIANEGNWIDVIQ